MEEDTESTRSRIIRAAQEMLKEVPNIDAITVRDIARRANVGTGLVNYHFKSKNALLGIAIGDTMAQIIGQSAQSASTTDPRGHLADMLTALCDIALENRALMHFVLSQSLTGGDTGTPLHLVPFLKGLFGEGTDEMQLRVIALQILHPLQVAALSPSAFKAYSGFDLEDARDRRRYVALLIGNLVPKQKEAAS